MSENQLKMFKQISQIIKSRNPAIPGDGVSIPVHELKETIKQTIPNIDRWWISSYNSITTLYPYYLASTLDWNNKINFYKISKECTNFIEEDSQGKIARISAATSLSAARPQTIHKCLYPVDFIQVSGWLWQGEIINIRARAYCSKCLYDIISDTLGKLMDADFYDRVEEKLKNNNDNFLYIISERLNYLQSNLPMVVKIMRNIESTNSEGETDE